MNGSHSIAGLEKSGAGTLSVRSYTSANNSVPQEDTLSISGTLSIADGTLNLRSRKAVQPLTVTAGSAEISSLGTLALGDADAAIKATFEATTLDTGGNLRIVRVTNANLGALTNNGTMNLSGYESATPVSSTTAIHSLVGTNTGKITTSGSNANATLSITGSNAVAATYAGIIEDTSSEKVATVAIAKSGTGTQIFSGANTYSGGTVISGGVLAVTNTVGSGLGTGAVNVNAGGTLAGNGIVEAAGSILAASGAQLAPGAGLGAGVAHLSLSGASNGAAPILSMAAGAEFTFNLASANTSDRINFLSYSTGDLVLDSVNGTAINVTGAQLGTFTLFAFDALSSDEAEALISNLRQGTGFTGFEFSNLFYSNNAIHLNVIPEPTGLLIFGAAGIAWVGLRRRKGKTL